MQIDIERTGKIDDACKQNENHAILLRNDEQRN